MIDVVTFYSPRPGHDKWMDYGPLLKLQKAIAEKFGHRHIVVSDRKLKGMQILRTDLPESLMKAILVGQLAYLEAWKGDHPFVFVDIDCLIGRDLSAAFDGKFHLGLTNRPGPHVSPINNGAMYVQPGNRQKVVEFFRTALDSCLDHWGGDQEAISGAAAPVPIGMVENEVQVHNRDGLLLAFLPMKIYNVTPEVKGMRHKRNPFVIHFKGTERKGWMDTYARSFIL